MYSILLRETLLITSFVLIALIFGNRAEESLSLAWGGCEPCDFDADQNCTLWCSLDVTNHHYNSHSWKYYTSDPTNFYTFQDDTNHSFDPETNTYNITLTLGDYYSGFYRCEFVVNGTSAPNETFHDFRVAQTAGVGLNGLCCSSEQCLAINAHCDVAGTNADLACNCHGDFNVPFDNSAGTPACFAPASFNDSCQSDDQCQASTADSVCQSNICQCEFDHLLNDDGTTCVKSGLSGGAIAAIVIGSLAGLAILGGIINDFVKWRKKKIEKTRKRMTL